MCFTAGVGMNWNTSWHKAPLTASLSLRPANPASADCFAQDIFPNKSTRTTNRQKMLCNGFPSRREGYYALLCRITSHLLGKPLHSIFWQFMVLVDLFGKMAKTKTTPHKSEVVQRHAPRQPSKWGTAAHVTFHRPPHLPSRGDT